MKKVFIQIGLFILILFQINSISAQPKEKRFYLSLSLATNKPDDRIYGIPIFRVDHFKQLNADNPPDNVFETSIGIGYKLFDLYNFRLSTDLRYIFERNNYTRPFNHCAILKEGEFCYYILKYLDIYSYNMIGNTISIDYSLNLYKKLALVAGISFQTDLKFLRYYKEALTSENRNYHWEFAFMSFELDPSIGLRFGRYEGYVFKRLWYYHKVDRAIHVKSSSDYPRLEEDYETYNPERWGFAMKYWF